MDAAPKLNDAAPPATEDLPRMSFGDHLDELRSRLMKCIGAMLVAVVALLPFKDDVTAIYIEPYRNMWDWAYTAFLEKLDERERTIGLANMHKLEREKVQFHKEYRDEIKAGTFPEHNQILTPGGFSVPYTLKATSGFQDVWTFMAAVLLFGLILASPVVLWQVWAFVAAGLYQHERHVVMRMVPFALLLLTAGVGFGYFVMVPLALYFLVELMNWTQVEPLFSVSEYFSMLLTLTAALGLVFQLPLLMLALQKVGLVTHAAMRKNWRMVVLGIFVVAAVLTPPDPFTQSIMAGPMVLLYFLGLWLTGRVERRTKLVHAT